MKSKMPIRSLAELGRVYTPGVADVCRLIEKEPEKASIYTTISNSVAIVTDGTAILGLGNIGSVAGMPVMEGKALYLISWRALAAFRYCLIRVILKKSSKQ